MQLTITTYGGDGNVTGHSVHEVTDDDQMTDAQLADAIALIETGTPAYIAVQLAKTLPECALSKGATTMTFDQWKSELATELSKIFGFASDEGERYITATGDDCWRESFDDGLSPKEAASEEANAAIDDYIPSMCDD